jgi:ribosomal protein S12 methylthiotransferase accessory factor
MGEPLVPTRLQADLLQRATADGLAVAFDVAPMYWSGATDAMGAADTRVVIRTVGNGMVIGPVVRDGARPCGTCLERRWLGTKPAEEQRMIAWWQHTATLAVGEGPAAPAGESVTDIAYTLARRLLEGRPASDVAGHADIFALDMLTLRSTRYTLVADSLCPACASPVDDSSQAALVELSAVAKVAPRSFRGRSLGDLSLSELAYANPVCGAFGNVVLRDHAHPCTAPALGQVHLTGGRGDHTFMWGGHASNYRRSAAAAMIEASERLAGFLPRSRSVTVFDSYANLGPDALHPEACGAYDEGAAEESDPGFVRFSPDLKVHWVWGYSLTRQSPVLVPEQLVYYCDFQRPEPLFVYGSSNGCATGTSLEEAILHALWELIERDAFLISWFGRLPLRRIDPWSCRTRETLFLFDRLEHCGYEPLLFDMRLDLDIPAVMAVARRRDRGLGHLLFAAGCSLDPEAAIQSALCETASYISDFPARTERRLTHLKELASDFRRVRKLDDHAAIYGLPAMASHASFLLEATVERSLDETYAEWPSEHPYGTDLRADVQFVIDRLARVGLGEVIVVEQTSPEQRREGLYTACVIVPGLVPIDFGFHRRRYMTLPRMFSVPATAGFRHAPLTRDEINPAPHPFP